MQTREATNKYRSAKFAYQQLKREYFQYGQKSQAREQELLRQVKRLQANVNTLREELKTAKRQEAEYFGKLSNANRIVQLFEQRTGLESAELLKQSIRGTKRKTERKELERVLSALGGQDAQTGNSLMLQQLAIKFRGDQQESQIKHEGEMRALSREFEQKLAVKDRDLEQMQATVGDLRFQLQLKTEDVTNLEKSLRMHEAYDPPASAFLTEEEKPSKLQRQMLDRITQLEIERDNYTKKLLDLGRVYKALKDSSLAKDRLLDRLRLPLRAQCQSLGEKVMALRKDLRGLLGSCAREVAEGMKELAEGVEQQVAARTVRALEREQLLRQECFYELLRSSGNVRVFCRLKPGGRAPEGVVRQSAARQNEVQVFNPAHQGLQKWKFDQVIEPSTENEQLQRASEPFVRAVLEGQNVCILAYGQTCAGKTYSILGSERVSGLFQHVLRPLLADPAPLSISVSQIYLERVFDLLPADTSPRKIEVTPPRSPPSPERGERLRRVPLTSEEQAMRVLKKALQLREMGANNVHEHSSRSHLLVSLYVATECLTLVDLAGSERLPTLKATPLELKRETVFINKSLLALREVIHAKAAQAKHVNYRNSVLTGTLRETLEGDAKVLFLAHLDPANLGESVNTLNIAQEARGVVLKR